MHNIWGPCLVHKNRLWKREKSFCVNCLPRTISARYHQAMNFWDKMIISRTMRRGNKYEACKMEMKSRKANTDLLLDWYWLLPGEKERKLVIDPHIAAAKLSLHHSCLPTHTWYIQYLLHFCYGPWSCHNKHESWIILKNNMVIPSFINEALCHLSTKGKC